MVHTTGYTVVKDKDDVYVDADDVGGIQLDLLASKHELHIMINLL